MKTSIKLQLNKDILEHIDAIAHSLDLTRDQVFEYILTMAFNHSMEVLKVDNRRLYFDQITLMMIRIQKDAKFKMA